MKKFLISPGFGAGWSTWAHGDAGKAKYLATYEPIIEFLEKGGRFVETSRNLDISPQSEKFAEPGRSVLKQLEADLKEEFGDDYTYFGGAEDLIVVEVGDDTQVRITEYDGSEGLQYRDETIWY